MVWNRRAEEYAAYDRRYSQSADQRGGRRSEGQGAAGRAWRHVARRAPADFGRHIAVETDKWREVVEFSGASAD